MQRASKGRNNSLENTDYIITDEATGATSNEDASEMDDDKSDGQMDAGQRICSKYGIGYPTITHTKWLPVNLFILTM